MFLYLGVDEIYCRETSLETPCGGCAEVPSDGDILPWWAVQLPMKVWYISNICYNIVSHLRKGVN